MSLLELNINPQDYDLQKGLSEYKTKFLTQTHLKKKTKKNTVNTFIVN